MNLAIVTFAVTILNIPFGYWRGNVRKFSPQWFLSVPIPIIILLRIISHVGFAFYTYVFLVGAFFTGQRVGSFIRKQRLSNNRKVE